VSLGACTFFVVAHVLYSPIRVIVVQLERHPQSLPADMLFRFRESIRCHLDFQTLYEHISAFVDVYVGDSTSHVHLTRMEWDVFGWNAVRVGQQAGRRVNLDVHVASKESYVASRVSREQQLLAALRNQLHGLVAHQLVKGKGNTRAGRRRLVKKTAPKRGRASRAKAKPKLRARKKPAAADHAGQL
jgi:hypothetical protein